MSQMLPLQPDTINGTPSPSQITRTYYPAIFQFAGLQAPAPFPEEQQQPDLPGVQQQPLREGLRTRQDVDYQSLNSFCKGGQDAWEPE